MCVVSRNRIFAPQLLFTVTTKKHLAHHRMEALRSPRTPREEKRKRRRLNKAPRSFSGLDITNQPQSLAWCVSSPIDERLMFSSAESKPRAYKRTTIKRGKRRANARQIRINSLAAAIDKSAINSENFEKEHVLTDTKKLERVLAIEKCASDYLDDLDDFPICELLLTPVK